MVVDGGGGSFKSRVKEADRSGAKYALILGDDEVQAQLIAVKPMVGGGEQVKASLSETIDILMKS